MRSEGLKKEINAALGGKVVEKIISVRSTYNRPKLKKKKQKIIFLVVIAVEKSS